MCPARMPVMAKECVPSGTLSTEAPSTPPVLQTTVPESKPPEPSDMGSKKICTWSTLAAAQVMPLKAQVRLALAVVGAAGSKFGDALVFWPPITFTVNPLSAYLMVPATLPTRSKLCGPGESGSTVTPSTPAWLQGRSALLFTSVSTWLSTLALITVTPAAAQLLPSKVQCRVALPLVVEGAASTATSVPPRLTSTCKLVW